jgi:hypothetical protein
MEHTVSVIGRSNSSGHRVAFRAHPRFRLDRIPARSVFGLPTRGVTVIATEYREANRSNAVRRLR